MMDHEKAQIERLIDYIDVVEQGTCRNRRR